MTLLSADFLTQPPWPAGRPGGHGELKPWMEWLVTFAWASSIHIVAAVVLHAIHSPIPLAAEETPGGKAVGVALAAALVLSGVWLHYVGRHFSNNKSGRTWVPQHKGTRLALALCFVFSTPVMLLAAEASLVAAANGGSTWSWWRIGAIAVWLVPAVLVAFSFNPFHYFAEVVAEQDKTRCSCLLMFVSNQDEAGDRLANLLREIGQMPLEALGTTPAEMEEVLYATLQRHAGAGESAAKSLMQDKFIQNLRGIQVHHRTLRHVYLLPSRESQGSAGTLREIIHGWDAIYRRLHALPGASPVQGGEIQGDAIASAAAAGKDDSFEVHIEAPVDYEDFEDVETRIKHTVAKITAGQKVPEDEIIIDLTSGQKPNSAVALIFTLGREVRAQYVRYDEKSGRSEVRAYDVHPVTQIGG